MTDLTQALESSLEAAQTGGQYVPAWHVPNDSALASVHAELDRLIRTQRRFRCEAVLPMPETP